MVQRPLICQKIKAHLISHVMTLLNEIKLRNAALLSSCNKISLRFLYCISINIILFQVREICFMVLVYYNNPEFK